MYETLVEKYADAKVYTITVGNRRLFWVKMHYVQERLGVKNMSDLARKEILQKIKSGNTKDVKKNWIMILILLLCMFVVILCQE